MKPGLLTELTQDKEKTIKVCSYHQDKEVTPLIWTFAFPYAEYWCPFCGCTEGMLGAGENITSTPELEERLTDYKKRSKKYLHSMALKSCSKTKYKGEWIDPDDLPKRSKAYWEKVSESWKYQNEV